MLVFFFLIPSFINCDFSFFSLPLLLLPSLNGWWVWCGIGPPDFFFGDSDYSTDPKLDVLGVIASSGRQPTPPSLLASVSIDGGLLSRSWGY